MNISEIIDLLSLPEEHLEHVVVQAQARAVTDTVFGGEVFQRGVIEFSSHCRKNCHYCGLRNSNQQIDRFRLSKEEILAAADLGVSLGLGTIVLQSGEDPAMDVLEVGEIVSTIKNRHNVAVTLSLGDHDEDTYSYWRDCGADRYLLKIETTNPMLHGALRPGQDIRTRLKRVETLQLLGYETGSGIITGLPGTTPEILAEDIRQLTVLGLDMIACGPFVPHPQTPLRDRKTGSVTRALTTNAVIRIANPGVNIPATSALDALAPDGRILGLKSGANVVMPSLTPENVRKQYTIYPGKNTALAPIQDAVTQLQQRIIAAGFIPTNSVGRNKAPEEYLHEQQQSATWRPLCDHAYWASQCGQVLSY